MQYAEEVTEEELSEYIAGFDEKSGYEITYELSDILARAITIRYTVYDPRNS